MPDVRYGIGADSTSDKTMASTLYTNGGSAARVILGTGRGAGGHAVAGVVLDPVADPEGPTGVEGEPANVV